VWAVPRLCEFYPGICLTTEEKVRKTLSKDRKNLSQGRSWTCNKRLVLYQHASLWLMWM